MVIEEGGALVPPAHDSVLRARAESEASSEEGRSDPALSGRSRRRRSCCSLTISLTSPSCVPLNPSVRFHACARAGRALVADTDSCRVAVCYLQTLEGQSFRLEAYPHASLVLLWSTPYSSEEYEVCHARLAHHVAGVPPALAYQTEDEAHKTIAFQSSWCCLALAGADRRES